ncbi:hypothetical protein [Streptomyces viridosporus]|uniref:hypothetical protein n=1 Tax=Streptomyces viridosporus TaxID=67581 RepID=UPI003CC6526B
MRSTLAPRPSRSPRRATASIPPRDADLSAHKSEQIRFWAQKNRVELCFTPTYASWANPIAARFGPLRQCTVANFHHRNHTAQTRALHASCAGGTRTPTLPTCRPPNGASASASAARRASAGTDERSSRCPDRRGRRGPPLAIER